MKSFFILVVALIVDGEVNRKLIFPTYAYETQQACELEAESYDKVPTITFNGSTIEFRTVCVERPGPGDQPIKRTV